MSDTRFVVGARHFGRFGRSRDENEAALTEARAETLGWALLTSATAEHYADLAGDAESHFVEALGVAARPGT